MEIVHNGEKENRKLLRIFFLIRGQEHEENAEVVKER